jgi:hypothetical protein
MTIRSFDSLQILMRPRLATVVSFQASKAWSLNLGAPMTLTATPCLLKLPHGPGYPFQHGGNQLLNRSTRLVVNKPVPARTRYLPAFELDASCAVRFRTRHLARCPEQFGLGSSTVDIPPNHANPFLDRSSVVTKLITQSNSHAVQLA